MCRCPAWTALAVIERLMERNRAPRGQGAVPLPQIVFATAYDQYAVRAFDVNAVATAPQFRLPRHADRVEDEGEGRGTEEVGTRDGLSRTAFC